jgi:hypothetical protein
MGKQRIGGNLPHRNNAPELQKKEQDAKRKQPIQTDDVTYINN